MKIRDFVPPIAIGVARRVLSHSGRKHYATYAEALVDCTEHGYENADIINVVLEKTKRYRDDIFRKREPLRLSATSAYSLCSLLGLGESQEINVIDFGGACGAHYFLARAVLPSSCRLRWMVVETPELVQRSEAVLSTDELSFSSNLIDAAASMKRIDLLHSSGTLSCVDKPHDYLRTLVSVAASHLLLNRLWLTKRNHDVITVHEPWLSWHGPGPMPDGIPDRRVRYPIVFPKESTFYDAINESYDVVATFDDPSELLPVHDEPIVAVGLLARRRR